MALLGLPGWRYLTTRDPGERLVLRALLGEAIRMNDTLQKNLAVHVVNTYARASRGR
jgi:hypothetical protein